MRVIGVKGDLQHNDSLPKTAFFPYRGCMEQRKKSKKKDPIKLREFLISSTEGGGG